MARPRNADAARTRQLLVGAALHHFSERGTDGVSLREVARDAGVSSAMIHHLFGGKAGLREAVVDVMYDRLAELSALWQRALDISPNDFPSTIDEAIRTGFAFGRENQAAVRLLMRDVMGRGALDDTRRAQFQTPFLASVSAAVRKHCGIDDVQARMVVQSLTTLVVRYVVSSDEELQHFTGVDNADAAARAVEAHLIETARTLMQSRLI